MDADPSVCEHGDQGRFCLCVVSYEGRAELTCMNGC